MPVGAGRSVLLVDDIVQILRAFGRILRNDGFDVTCAANAPAALALIEKNAFAVVLTDYNMVGPDGLWLLARVRGYQPEARRLLMSGRPLEGIAEHLGTGLLHGFLNKTDGSAALLEVVRG